jgi:hypothetical protein
VWASAGARIAIVLTDRTDEAVQAIAAGPLALRLNEPLIDALFGFGRSGFRWKELGQQPNDWNAACAGASNPRTPLLAPRFLQIASCTRS